MGAVAIIFFSVRQKRNFFGPKFSKIDRISKIPNKFICKSEKKSAPMIFILNIFQILNRVLNIEMRSKLGEDFF